MGVAGFILLGTPVELLLVEHTEEFLQWIPFILSGIGLVALGWAWRFPGHTSLRTLRWTMLPIALGSLYGVYEHFIANYAFSAEIHPAYSMMENIWEALKGASPMMAPGILLLAALLAYASTYKHPALKNPW